MSKLMRLFGLPIWTNGVNDNHIYYTPVTYKQLLFMIWGVKNEDGIKYTFSVYENGVILNPAKDVRFAEQHRRTFKSKEWLECYFNSLSLLIKFVISCSF